MQRASSELLSMHNVVVNDKDRSWSMRRWGNEAEVLAVEDGKPAVKSVKPRGVGEAALRALAEAERARRAAAGQGGPQERDIGVKRMSAPPSAAASSQRGSQGSRPPTAQGSRPPTAQGTAAEQQKYSSVVKVHPDGSFDLKMSSGEVVERVGPEWLERLQIGGPPSAPPPPPTGGSRPGTGGSRPPTGQRDASDGGARLPGAPSAMTSALSESKENAAPAKRVNPAAAAVQCAAFSLIHVGATAAAGPNDSSLVGVLRKGGRHNPGAQRAAQCQMSSLLSWD